MNDRAYLSIGEVLALLQDEFPDVTISKIRFLESQGLIDPERTPSGYRKFYDATSSGSGSSCASSRSTSCRCKVIKDRLDSGEPRRQRQRRPDGPARSKRDRRRHGRRRAPAHPTNGRPSHRRGPIPASLTADQLCAATGLSRRELNEVERYGLLTGKTSGADHLLRP